MPLLTLEEITRLAFKALADAGASAPAAASVARAIRRVSGRMVVMYLGQVVEDSPTGAMFAAPRHPYTAALLSARAQIDPARRQHRIVLTGEIPSPVNPPAGCRFHTRCPLVQPRCRTDVPPLVIDQIGSYRCHFPLAPGDRRLQDLAHAAAHA